MASALVGYVRMDVEGRAADLLCRLDALGYVRDHLHARATVVVAVDR